MTAKKLSMNIWEWTDDRTNWTKFLPADIDKVEQGYLQAQAGRLPSGYAEMGQMSWNRATDNTRYRFDYNKMTQINLSSKKERGIRRRTNVPCCPRLHELTYLDDTPAEYRARGLYAVCDDCRRTVSTQGYYHCSVPQCEYDRCLTCQGDKIFVRTFDSMESWAAAFTQLSQAQLHAMTSDVSSSAELRKESLSVVWRTWSDVGRTFESSDGQNTTDMTFFAIAPLANRSKDRPYSTLPGSAFVPFPAVRAPNYFDTIDVLPSANALTFMAKNRAGVPSVVTLSQFLASIGTFIADFDVKDSWADAIDDTPLQLGSQFSILPVPTGKAEIGVAAFGKGNVNLHVIIGPGGDIGWAPEVPNAGKRIFFKSADGKFLRAISLVPEQSTKVKKEYFRVEVHQESVAEEKQRYIGTKNRLLHLQIEMADVPGAIAAITPTPRESGPRKNCGHALVAFSTPREGSHVCDVCQRSFPQGSTMYGCRPCDFDMCPQCVLPQQKAALAANLFGAPVQLPALPTPSLSHPAPAFPQPALHHTSHAHTLGQPAPALSQPQAHALRKPAPALQHSNQSTSAFSRRVDFGQESSTPSHPQPQAQFLMQQQHPQQQRQQHDGHHHQQQQQHSLFDLFDAPTTPAPAAPGGPTFEHPFANLDSQSGAQPPGGPTFDNPFAQSGAAGMAFPAQQLLPPQPMSPPNSGFFGGGSSNSGGTFGSTGPQPFGFSSGPVGGSFGPSSTSGQFGSSGQFGAASVPAGYPAPSPAFNFSSSSSPPSGFSSPPCFNSSSSPACGGFSFSSAPSHSGFSAPPSGFAGFSSPPSFNSSSFSGGPASTSTPSASFGSSASTQTTSPSPFGTQSTQASLGFSFGAFGSPSSSPPASPACSQPSSAQDFLESLAFPDSKPAAPKSTSASAPALDLFAGCTPNSSGGSSSSGGFGRGTPTMTGFGNSVVGKSSGSRDDECWSSGFGNSNTSSFGGTSNSNSSSSATTSFGYSGGFSPSQPTSASPNARNAGGWADFTSAHSSSSFQTFGNSTATASCQRKSTPSNRYGGDSGGSRPRCAGQTEDSLAKKGGFGCFDGAPRGSDEVRLHTTSYGFAPRDDRRDDSRADRGSSSRRVRDEENSRVDPKQIPRPAEVCHAPLRVEAYEQPAQPPPPQAEEIDAGIQLANVQVGDVVGPIEFGDQVPLKAPTSTSITSFCKRASRKSGVAVRASWLYYGVTGDGKVDAERLRRFVKQMLFERREKQLQFGSLVSGFGSWGGPENAPIKLFGMRLTDACDKTAGGPSPVKGIRNHPLLGLVQACASLHGIVTGVENAVATALSRTQGRGNATRDHTAAIYLYTMASAFYKDLNAALRDTNREKLKPFYGYLRLLAEAMVVLPTRAAVLWRGVGLDLEKDHAIGNEVTWWGVSSCTPKLTVAQGFLGSSGPRTLFSVNTNTAVPIQELSAFKGEEEFILAPGTRLRVESATRESGGLLRVVLVELPPPRHVD